MPSLLELQHAVAYGVRSGDFAGAAPYVVSDAIAAADRLAIYRNTARVGVSEALRAGFPAVAALTGGAFFDMAAARLFEREPPETACLGDYGASFGAFLDLIPEASGVPYLGDVARYEWALGRAAVAPDAHRLPADALAAVPADRHAMLRFDAHPSVQLLRSSFPVDRITDAVLADDEVAMQAIDLDDGPLHLLIDRGPTGLRAARVTASEFAVLERLFAGLPLFAVLQCEPQAAAAVIAQQFLSGRIAALTADATASEPCA